MNSNNVKIILYGLTNNYWLEARTFDVNLQISTILIFCKDLYIYKYICSRFYENIKYHAICILQN